MDLHRPEIAISAGLRFGLLLGLVVVVLGVLGLSPSAAWIPEVLLLAAFAFFPIAIVGVTGFRVGRLERSLAAGALAGAIAGGIGGCIGGLTYVAFGKPVVNVLVGLIAGLAVGAIVGAAGAWFAVRRVPD